MSIRPEKDKKGELILACRGLEIVIKQPAPEVLFTGGPHLPQAGAGRRTANTLTRAGHNFVGTDLVYDRINRGAKRCTDRSISRLKSI